MTSEIKNIIRIHEFGAIVGIGDFKEIFVTERTIRFFGISTKITLKDGEIVAKDLYFNIIVRGFFFIIFYKIFVFDNYK